MPQGNFKHELYNFTEHYKTNTISLLSYQVQELIIDPVQTTRANLSL